MSPFDVLASYRATQAALGVVVDPAASEPDVPSVPDSQPVPAQPAPARVGRRDRMPGSFTSDRPQRVLDAMAAAPMNVRQVADLLGVDYGEAAVVLRNMASRDRICRLMSATAAAGGAVYALPNLANDPGLISLALLVKTPRGEIALTAVGAEAQDVLRRLLPAASR